MIKILFVCIHNSARSQMAEAFVNCSAEGRVFAQSAGLTPGKLNAAVVEVMKEVGIDISQNKTKSVDEFISRHEIFDYVITVCDETSAERCPTFPGKAQRLHWGFEDPSSLQLSGEEKLNRTRLIRDEIKTKVTSWLNSLLH
jgi:arsenate reductase (thioredoxin)